MDKTMNSMGLWDKVQVILSFHVKHGETRMNDNQPCLRPCSWKTRHGNRLLGCFWGGEYLDIRDHRDLGYTRRTIFRFGVTFPNPIGWNNFDANLAPYTASLREQMLQVAGTLHFSQFRGAVSKRREVWTKSVCIAATASYSYCDSLLPQGPENCSFHHLTPMQWQVPLFKKREQETQDSRLKNILEWWTARFSTL